MALASSELRLRIVSAVVLAAVAFSEVWAGGWLFAVFVAAVAFTVFLEWTSMIGLTAFYSVRLRACIIMLAVLSVLVVFGTNLAILALCIGAIAAYLSTLPSTKETAVWTAFAVFYCGMAAIALADLRNNEQGIAMIFLLFAIVLGTDIGAYFVGRKFGGPKLAPRISPGKTQSGAVGGLIIAMVVACMIAVLTQIINPFIAVLVAAGVSIISQIGDLFESYIKRRFGVKDSGSILPGHGGMFDRVDGLMPAAIALFVLSKLSLFIP